MDNYKVSCEAEHLSLAMASSPSVAYFGKSPGPHRGGCSRKTKYLKHLEKLFVEDLSGDVYR